jgi:3-methylcrotonyl-CoA carboxylase alpha subunit
MFRKLLIANRGEIACRVIATAHRLGIATVAVYSDADARARHVALADEAWPIGPAPARESYLNIERIIDVARRSGAQAIHPGYGFLSENADFAEACVQAGIVFVGPPPGAIRAMGSKAAAKALMQRSGVPLVPGYHGEAQDPATLRDAAERVGYPVLLKASAGGGGKGMRVVEAADELEDAFGAAAAEAAAAFGNPTLYVEKVLVPARHIEIQVLCDGHGNVLTLGERECSIQRRHQKLIEETPSPALTPELREEMESAAERACGAVGYVNAGTLEFLLGPGAGFSFIELNARLQVEHPVTELTTGIDLVRAQLQVAAGEPLAVVGRAPRRGHSIEIRLNAEDAERDFMPAPGLVTRFRPAQGPGVRVDTFVEDGTRVTPHYDSLLAKLVVWDVDRPSAIARAIRALEETEIEGVPTTRELAIDVLRSSPFADGSYSTSTLAELMVTA